MGLLHATSGDNFAIVSSLIHIVCFAVFYFFNSDDKKIALQCVIQFNIVFMIIYFALKKKNRKKVDMINSMTDVRRDDRAEICFLFCDRSLCDNDCGGE